MQVHRSIESLPNFRNAVITIGTFDGVHLGHQKIISALVQEAKAAGGESIIITFDPHPRKIVNATEHLQLINTLQEKIDLLQDKSNDDRFSACEPSIIACNTSPGMRFLLRSIDEEYSSLS